MPQITINGVEHTIDVHPQMPLLWAIRDILGLTGTKFGCGVGACTVHLDGQAVRSCLTSLADAQGHAVVTIEGLSGDGNHPVQRAWRANNVPQCGYCQAGQIMQAAALPKQTPHPTTDQQIVDAMSGYRGRTSDDSANTIKNGVVYQNTFIGYLHYEGTCYWCHGQDATGSTFAPSLVDRLKTPSHDGFENIVVNGGVVNGQPVGYPTSNVFVMPAFGTNPNVMCYLDDIHAYLRARSDGVIGRGRPEHEPVTQAAEDQGDACLGFAPSPTSANASTRT